MKTATILASLLLGAACTPIELREQAPSGPCVVTDMLRGRWIGQRYRTAMRDVIQAQANARTARVLAPGDAATRDLREDRLNIMLDDGAGIEGLHCG